MPWLGLEIVFWVWYTRQANELNTAHDIIPEKTTWIGFVFFKIFTAMNSLNISYSPSFSFLFLSFHDLSCYSVSGLVGVENFFPVLLFFTFYFFLSSIFFGKTLDAFKWARRTKESKKLMKKEWMKGWMLLLLSKTSEFVFCRQSIYSSTRLKMVVRFYGRAQK